MEALHSLFTPIPSPPLPLPLSSPPPFPFLSFPPPSPLLSSTFPSPLLPSPFPSPPLSSPPLPFPSPLPSLPPPSQSVEGVIETESGEEIPIKLLDTDSVTQAKEKVLDALYRNTPVSKRPQLTEVDLGEGVRV